MWDQRGAGWTLGMTGPEAGGAGCGVGGRLPAADPVVVAGGTRGLMAEIRYDVLLTEVRYDFLAFLSSLACWYPST